MSISKLQKTFRIADIARSNIVRVTAMIVTIAKMMGDAIIFRMMAGNPMTARMGAIKRTFGKMGAGLTTDRTFINDDIQHR